MADEQDLSGYSTDELLSMLGDDELRKIAGVSSATETPQSPSFLSGAKHSLGLVGSLLSNPQVRGQAVEQQLQDNLLVKAAQDPESIEGIAGLGGGIGGGALGLKGGTALGTALAPISGGFSIPIGALLGAALGGAAGSQGAEELAEYAGGTERGLEERLSRGKLEAALGVGLPVVAKGVKKLAVDMPRRRLLPLTEDAQELVAVAGGSPTQIKRKALSRGSAVPQFDNLQSFAKEGDAEAKKILNIIDKDKKGALNIALDKTESIGSAIDDFITKKGKDIKLKSNLITDRDEFKYLVEASKGADDEARAIKAVLKDLTSKLPMEGTEDLITGKKVANSIGLQDLRDARKHFDSSINYKSASQLSEKKEAQKLVADMLRDVINSNVDELKPLNKEFNTYKEIAEVLGSGEVKDIKGKSGSIFSLVKDIPDSITPSRSRINKLESILNSITPISTQAAVQTGVGDPILDMVLNEVNK